MSVLASLKKFAENPETPEYDKAYLGNPEDSEASGELGATLEAAPIPGQSLTNSPDTPSAFERPPKYTDQRKYIDALYLQLTREEVMPNILDSLRTQLPVEEIAYKLLKGEIRKGSINVDMMLLCIEPVIYMLIAFATLAEIDPVLYPEGEADDNADTMESKFREAARLLRDEGEEDEDPRLTVDDLRAPTILPQSLMQRTQEALNKTGDTNEPTQSQ